jgi:opacity protein-like surface antigen
VRKIYVCAMVLVMAAVLAMPGIAQSAMWIGGEIGGNLIGNNSVDANASAGGFNASATADNVKWNNPNVIGGLTLGYDFVNSGFLGYSYPDWMKYFSFATDFTYNNNNICSQNLSGSYSISGHGINLSGPFNVNLNTLVPGAGVEGYMAAWTFLFMAHYGFLPDSEVPGGRLIPYVGVGPGILWSGITVRGLNVNKSANSTNIALVTEAGIRYMCLKNVSLDAGFRYRYATPEYDFSGNFAGVPYNANVSTTINSFSFLFRANYHF